MPEDSKEEIRAIICSNCELGSDRETVEVEKIGALEMTSGAADIEGWVPEAGLCDITFHIKEIRRA